MRFASALLLAALLAGPAQSEPRRTLTLTRVVVSDLDLTTEAGAAQMFRRLNAAAREVCHEPVSMLFPGSEGREWRCRREALAAAIERLKAPKLSVAYAEWLSAGPDTQTPSPRVR